MHIQGNIPSVKRDQRLTSFGSLPDSLKRCWSAKYPVEHITKNWAVIPPTSSLIVHSDFAVYSTLSPPV